MSWPPLTFLRCLIGVVVLFVPFWYPSWIGLVPPRAGFMVFSTHSRTIYPFLCWDVLFAQQMYWKHFGQQAVSNKSQKQVRAKKPIKHQSSTREVTRLGVQKQCTKQILKQTSLQKCKQFSFLTHCFWCILFLQYSWPFFRQQYICSLLSSRSFPLFSEICSHEFKLFSLLPSAASVPFWKNTSLFAWSSSVVWHSSHATFPAATGRQNIVFLCCLAPALKNQSSVVLWLPSASLRVQKSLTRKRTASTLPANRQKSCPWVIITCFDTHKHVQPHPPNHPSSHFHLPRSLLITAPPAPPAHTTTITPPRRHTPPLTSTNTTPQHAKQMVSWPDVDFAWGTKAEMDRARWERSKRCFPSQ